MKAISKILDRVAAAMGAVSLICFGGIMLFIVADVLLRYAFKQPILGSYEIVEQLMFCGVFASFSYAQQQNSHIHITMLITKMPKTLALLIFGLGGVLSATLAAFVCYAATQQAILAKASAYTTAILKIPTYPFLWIEVAAMVIFALTLLLGAIRTFAAIGNKELQTEIISEWN